MTNSNISGVNISKIEHMRISVSYICNLKCEHCYVPEEFRYNYKNTLKQDELTLKEIIDFLDYLRTNCGLKKVSVTGGEPLLKVLWSRTKTVLEYINKHGLEAQLNTGGLGQIPISEIVSIFDDPSKLLFQFSLDGASAETVDKFRGRKGVFASALRQMQEAMKGGAKVQARYTVNNNNYDEAYKAYQLVAQIPITSFKVKPMFAAGTAYRESSEYLIDSREKIKQLQEQLVMFSDKVPTSLELPPPIFLEQNTLENKSNVKLVTCTCGVGSGYLSSNGDLFPCSYMIGDADSEMFKIGNIRDAEFNILWNKENPNLEIYRQYDNNPEICPSQTTLIKNAPMKKNYICSLG